MDFSKGVLFDPGYSKFALPFSPNIDAGYNMLLSIKAPHQRKFKFQILYPQFLKLLENSVAFYLGCLLWATFITRNFSSEPKDILDNNFLGREVVEDDMLFEINYAINYVEKLKKDCKYYLGKTCNIPTEWVKILAVYKEFLILNNYLVNTKSTADINLPASLKETNTDNLESILNIIESALKSGDLTKLFDAKDLIF